MRMLFVSLLLLFASSLAFPAEPTQNVINSRTVPPGTTYDLEKAKRESMEQIESEWEEFLLILKIAGIVVVALIILSCCCPLTLTLVLFYCLILKPVRRRDEERRRNEEISAPQILQRTLTPYQDNKIVSHM